MLLIKTKLKETLNKGIGLFADEFIPKDTIIWKYDSKLVKIFNINEINDNIKDFIFKYSSTLDNINFQISLDNERFINHSSINPNIKYTDKYLKTELNYGFALCDIQIGEELLSNYNDFDINEIDFLEIN